MSSHAIDVVYEKGIFRPIGPVLLPEGSRARVYAADTQGPLITKTPGVCSGRACVAGSRITVWGIVAQRRLGLDDAAILEALPALTPDQLYAAQRYAEQHVDEIAQDIAENEDAE